jgi:hypothetical protein
MHERGNTTARHGVLVAQLVLELAVRPSAYDRSDSRAEYGVNMVRCFVLVKDAGGRWIAVELSSFFHKRTSESGAQSHDFVFVDILVDFSRCVCFLLFAACSPLLGQKSLKIRKMLEYLIVRESHGIPGCAVMV